MYSIHNREDSEKINELIKIQSPVEELELQDRNGKQNFHEDVRKQFEPVTDKFLKTFEDLTTTMMLTSKENNRALDDLNDKLLEIMKDRGILASSWLSPVSKISNHEHTSQIKLVKDLNSNRVNDLLINKTIPVTLYNNLLTFCDTDRKFEIRGDILKMMTNKNCNVDHVNLSDNKSMVDFAKKCTLTITFG